MQKFDNPYLLLTPGPLSTSITVREAMLKDWCTWDNDYNQLVQKIRINLLRLADTTSEVYTSVLMQGSGTFVVEATLGTIIPASGNLLVIANGAYGERMVEIAKRLYIKVEVMHPGETSVPDLEKLENFLQRHTEITHIAMVHCETTTGILNPMEEVVKLAKKYGKIMILDAMSSFGGISIKTQELGIDALISSANKCIQGVPGFGFVIVKKALMEKSSNQARSLSLDLYDQWKTMEKNSGKWRYTSPTHTVRAFWQAMLELDAEGGIEKRYQRYQENHQILTTGMDSLGFKCLISNSLQSPIITSFIYPKAENFDFNLFYQNLKERGFVIYPGKVTSAETFRIGNIGHVFPEDMHRLIKMVEASMYWKKTN